MSKTSVFDTSALVIRKSNKSATTLTIYVADALAALLLVVEYLVI